MAIELGPIKIGLELDTEGLQEQMEGIFGEDASDGVEAFKESFKEIPELFGELPKLFNEAVDGMEKFTAKSAALTSGADILQGSMNALTGAFHEMMVAGEISAKTFGAAMKAILAEELAAISTRALVNALYATGVGLLHLAMQNYTAAGQAFAAAGVFAAVAVAAGVGAMALGAGGGGGYGDEGGYDEYGPSGPQTDQVQQANQQRYLNLTVNGNILGQEEYIKEQFIPALNTLVIEDDAVVVTTDRSNIARPRK